MSAVGLNQIELMENEAVLENASSVDKEDNIPKKEYKYSTDKKISQTLAENHKQGLLTKIGLGAGKVISTFYQAGREAVQTLINTIIPFMAFVSLLIGIIQGSGIGNVFANLMSPLAGNIIGLLLIGLICLYHFYHRYWDLGR